MTDEPTLPPPHDLAAEEAVLAAGLWGDPLAYELGLSPWAFWAVEHRQIWAVLLAAEELLGDDIDAAARCWLVTRLVPLRDQRLLEILQTVPLWCSVEDCAGRLRRRARQRQLLEAMARIEGAWRSGQEASPKLLWWTGRRLMRMAEEEAT